MLDEDTKGKVEARLKRIAGQVAGVERMIQGDRYCIDVILQISAARAALAKVSKIMLEGHIQTCVSAAFESEDPGEREAKIAELMRVFDKSCNC